MNTWIERYALGKQLRHAGAASAWARGLVGLAAALVLLAAAAPAAEAGSDTPMGPNKVLDVEAFDGPQFGQPADGRIRGYGFAVAVTEAGPVARTRRIGGWLTAGDGQRLVGFKLRFDQTADIDHRTHGALIVDGARIPAEDYMFSVREGEHAYVASVPSGAKEVQLELSAAGLAQTFSLTQLARVGTQPTVLYRDGISPEVVRDNAGERTLRVKDVESGAKGALVIELDKARLSFFTPPEPVAPADDPARAYFVVEATASLGGDFEVANALPSSALTATLADGTNLEALHAGPEDEGLLPGAYYFPVPADVEAVRMTIRPGTFDAWDRGVSGAVPSPVRAEGAAVFDVEFTPGGAAKLPPLPREAVASPARPDASDVPAEDPDDGASRLAPVLVLLLLLAAAAAAFFWARRRQTPAELPEPVRVDLRGFPIVTLAGPGSADAASAALADVVKDDHTEVVVLDRGPASGVADRLKAGAVRHAADGAALAAEVEAACLAAAQAFASAAEEGANGAAHNVVVLAPGQTGEELAAIASRPSFDGVALRVVLLGGDAAPVLDVAADGTVVLPDGTLGRLPVSEPPPQVRTAAAEEEPRPPTAPPDDRRVGVVVDLLGPYRVSVDGAVVGSGRKKARELLALLALRPEGVTMDAAIEALWPGAGPEKSADFRQAVTNLRAVLRVDGEPVVSRVGARYQLDRSRIALDVADFEEAARSEPDAAVALYRGELAEGEDYPWIEPDRERLRRTVLDLLAQSVQRRRSAGDLASAAAALDRAVDIDRYSEPLYRELMAVQREQGREDAVRRTYDRLVQALAELDAEPEPRTAALLRDAAPQP